MIMHSVSTVCIISSNLIFVGIVTVYCSCTEFKGVGLLDSLISCLKCASVINLATHFSSVLCNKLRYVMSDIYLVL
jgi:hypothetical protein